MPEASHARPRRSGPHYGPLIAAAIYNWDVNKPPWTDPTYTNSGGALYQVVLDNSFAGLNGQSQSTINNWISELQADGAAIVCGYVPVANGSRDVSDIKNGWTPPGKPFQYGVEAWYHKYPAIRGIYFDQGPVDDGTVVQPNGKTTQQNYQAYDLAIIESKTRDFALMFVEAAGYPLQWVQDVAGDLLIWEGDYNTYTTQPWQYYAPWEPPGQQTGPPPAWWQTSAYTHTVTNVTTDAELKKVIEIANGQRRCSSLYATAGGVGSPPTDLKYQIDWCQNGPA